MNSDIQPAALGDNQGSSVSLEVDFDGTPTQALLKLIEAKQQAQKRIAKWRFTINSHPGLFRRLQELEIEPRLNLSDGQIEITFTGDGPKLSQVWGELRRQGFKNDSFPRKGMAQFATYFRAPDQRESMIWLYFSSTVCRQVQVGTRMVEQPIYETQCGELPALDDEHREGSLSELI
jgi:hypothetical protein